MSAGLACVQEGCAHLTRVLFSQGMKVSCTHFQCAAGAFTYLRDHFPHSYSVDMSHQILNLNINLMLVGTGFCLHQGAGCTGTAPCTPQGQLPLNRARGVCIVGCSLWSSSAWSKLRWDPSAPRQGLCCCRQEGLPPAGGKEVWGGSGEVGRLCTTLLIPGLFGHPLRLAFAGVRCPIKEGAVAGGSCQGSGPGAGLDTGVVPRWRGNRVFPSCLW